jgi:hypothetical protein
MPKPKNDYQQAIDDIASDFRHRQFPDLITADDARPAVDAGVIADWLGQEGAARDLEIVLGDLCIQRLNSDQAKTVLCALAIGHADKVQELLQAALVEQVARDIAYEAQKFNDNYCPTDSEMAGSITPNDIDDPFLAERRSFTRNHNASIAGWRRV